MTQTHNLSVNKSAIFPVVFGKGHIHPFGMTMPGRKMSADSYRYGFGSHEKDDEVKGAGNHLSFEGYGYDPRLGRRFGLDPIDQISISNYAAFKNNPMLFIDANGENPREGNHVLKIDFDKCFVSKINDKTPKFRRIDKYLEKIATNRLAANMPLPVSAEIPNTVSDIVSNLFTVEDLSKGESALNNASLARNWRKASRSNTGYEYTEFTNENDKEYAIIREVKNLNKELGVEQGFENIVTSKRTFELDSKGELSTEVSQEYWAFNNNGGKIEYEHITIDMSKSGSSAVERGENKKAESSKYKPNDE